MAPEARYTLVDGPHAVIDQANHRLPVHYHAEFAGPGDERLERFLTDEGRATLLNAVDRGGRTFTAAELEEISAARDIDALLARYEEEAGEG